jgi:hypothetical protein
MIIILFSEPHIILDLKLFLYIDKIVHHGILILERLRKHFRKNQTIYFQTYVDKHN